MVEWLWRRVARILARPAVTDWLWRRVAGTPYLRGPSHSRSWWLFNPRSEIDGKPAKRWFPLSVKLTVMPSGDTGPGLRMNAENVRSFVLIGAYEELYADMLLIRLRSRGDTALLRKDRPYRIHRVDDRVGALVLQLVGRPA